jgi:hypothetical protein
MSDFEALLNAEIVEAGRVPDIRVVSRARRIGEILEEHYPDRNTMTPSVSPSDDIIIFTGEITDDSGFKLTVLIKEDDQKVEEQLIVWHSADNVFINIKGTLAVKDLEYALNRDKEYAYLDEPIED